MSGELAYESIVVRIDKCHVHVGFPFWTYACKTEVRVMPPAGGLRADSLRGHRHHIRLFFSMFDAGIWVSPHRCEQSSLGLRTVLGRPSRMVDSLGCIYLPGWEIGPERLALSSVSLLQIFGSF